MKTQHHVLYQSSRTKFNLSVGACNSWPLELQYLSVPTELPARHSCQAVHMYWLWWDNLIKIRNLTSKSSSSPVYAQNTWLDWVQLKLETLKSQGLENITRGIRKSTHPKVFFSILLKYNMPLETGPGIDIEWLKISKDWISRQAILFSLNI